MSCYTTSRVTQNPEYTQLRQRCAHYVEKQRTGLTETFSDCQRIDRRLENMSQRLNQQIAHYEGVIHRVEQDVSGAREHLVEVREQMTVLRQVCLRIRESSRTLLQTSRQSLDIGIEKTECMSGELSSLLEATSRAREAIAEVPQSLGQCFKTVEDKLAELMRLHGKSEDESRNLGKTWEQVADMHNNLVKTRDEWQEIHSQLEGVQQSISSRIGSITLVTDSMEMSHAAAYALLEALQERKFALVAYERTSDGVEAFLEDIESRKVAFRVTSDTDVAQRVLLELNVSDFEGDDVSVSCEDIKEELLDVISETGILEDTRTYRPHRNNFSGTKMKVKLERERLSASKSKDRRLKGSE